MYVGKFTSKADMATVVNRNLQSASERNNIDRDNTKKDSGAKISIKVKSKKVDAADKDKLSVVDMLNMHKDRIKKRMDVLSGKLAEIAVTKDALLYEEQTVVNENGEETKIKVKRNLTEKEQEVLEKLENQELGINKSFKDLAGELSETDLKIEAAQIAETKKKTLEDKKAEEKNDKPKTEKPKSDEDEQAEFEKKQMQFFAESDSIQKYVRRGKVLRAQMQSKKGHLESDMATDRFNKAASEKRAAASLAAASVRTGHLSPEEAKRKRAEAYNAVGTTPDTSIMAEKADISAGNFSSNESGAAKELAKVQIAIEGLSNSIDSQVAKLNKRAKAMANASDTRHVDGHARIHKKNEEAIFKVNTNEAEDSNENSGNANTGKEITSPAI